MKNKKEKIIIRSNCPGVYGDFDKLVDELGIGLTLDFIKHIEEDRMMEKTFKNKGYLCKECIYKNSSKKRRKG